MHMVFRQPFVSFTRVRQVSWLCCIFSALTLVIAGCSDRTADAYAEAQNARALLQQGDLPGASRAIRRAMTLREDQVDILLLDAQIKTAMGNLRAAYDSYRMVLALDPRRPEALVAVAQLGIALGDRREAIKAADLILSMVPGQPDALLVKGIDALNRKNHDEAIAIGDRMLASDPSERRGIVLKARGYALNDRRDEALAMLRQAAEQYGNDEMLASAMLENARDTGDVATMLEQLALLRQFRAESVDLAIDEINIRYKSGDADGARKVAADFIDTFGNKPDAMRRLGRLWREYDPDPLDDTQLQAIEANGAINARQVAGRHYLAQGEHETAARLVSSSADPLAKALLVRVAAAVRQDGAIRAAAGILSRDRTNCDALLAAAEWNLAARRYTDAVKPAQVAAAECRDIPDGYLVAARAYDGQNRSAGAERVYREGLAAHPDSRDLTQAYARWLLQRGREDAAETVAEGLTDRAPARVSSWRLLEQICASTGNSPCIARARRGGALAARNYSIDLAPGERVKDPLLGRQWR